MTTLQYFWRLYMRLKNPTCTIRSASLSKNVKLEKGVTLEYGSHVMAELIGRYSYINKYCLIEKNTTIGRFCSVAYNAKIGLGGHPTDWVSTHAFAYDPKYGFVKESRKFQPENKKQTVIGNDVWIGTNAIILQGVKIGDGAIIGANSLVTTDVEPYAIMIGNPAKLHRYRFDEKTIKQLVELKWWDQSINEIKMNIDLFKDPALLLKNK